MNILEVQRGNSVLEGVSDKERTLQSYEDSASEYAINVESLHPQKQAEKFLSLVPPGGTILDVGCGSGRDAQILSDQGFQVTGIDFSAAMIEIAKKKAPKATFKVMDMQSLHMNETFDAVWASASLLHVPKKEISKVLEKIWSLLNDKGSFYISLKKGMH